MAGICTFMLLCDVYLFHRIIDRIGGKKGERYPVGKVKIYQDGDRLMVCAKNGDSEWIYAVKIVKKESSSGHLLIQETSFHFVYLPQEVGSRILPYGRN